MKTIGALFLVLMPPALAFSLVPSRMPMKTTFRAQSPLSGMRLPRDPRISGLGLVRVQHRACGAMLAARGERDWRQSALPVANGRYPAREHCSKCGLCDSYFVAKVKEACPFLGDGMRRMEDAERAVHGRARNGAEEDELFFGVHDVLLAAHVTRPLQGAQWGGLITTIACRMLTSGQADAVLCVGSEEHDRFAPRPVLARSTEEVLACRGVKPVLAPLLELLPEIEQSGVKRLVVCGVGCQIQALRSVERHLGLEKLFVLGTNCVDNAPARAALDKFLHVASRWPESAVSYEFMPDYHVHINHCSVPAPGITTRAAGAGDTRERECWTEKVPYFTLPAHELKDVIAPSCYSCFDYSNALADLVVGYMAVPHDGDRPMHRHPQSVLVRNARGWLMLEAAQDLLALDRVLSPTAAVPARTAALLARLAENGKEAPRDGARGHGEATAEAQAQCDAAPDDVTLTVTTVADEAKATDTDAGSTSRPAALAPQGGERRELAPTTPPRGRVTLVRAGAPTWITRLITRALVMTRLECLL